MTSIYIVGEAWGEHEERFGLPFQGPSGYVLETLLKSQGLRRKDVILDNVFNFRPVNNDVERLLTKEESLRAPGLPAYKGKLFLHRDYAEHVAQLRARVLAARPNIILALGNTPLWALAGLSGIKKWRGSPVLCSFAPIKLIATYHPAAVLRQWDLRPIVYADLEKAIRESTHAELSRPSRKILFSPTLEEIAAFYERYIRPAPFVSCDIETKGQQITEVGFAPSADRALVIPFYTRAKVHGNFWPTPEAERQAWEWVRRICAEKPLLGQNFSYDAQYLLRTMGIPTPKWEGDTMLLHHALQPEMEKGLGFLGSIYTMEPSWKFMRQDHSTLKKED